MSLYSHSMSDTAREAEMDIAGSTSAKAGMKSGMAPPGTSGETHTVKLNGTNFSVVSNQPSAELNNALTAAIKTGSINGHPVDTAAGKHELSVLRYQALGKSPEQAQTLSATKTFTDGPLRNPTWSPRVNGA